MTASTRLGLTAGADAFDAYVDAATAERLTADYRLRSDGAGNLTLRTINTSSPVQLAAIRRRRLPDLVHAVDLLEDRDTRTAAAGRDLLAESLRQARPGQAGGAVTRALNNTPLALHATSAPAWQLWAQVAQLSHHLQLGDWLLVGGQMVALHCHLAGINPGRATIDIDVVANVVVTSDATSTTTATHASVVSTAGWTGLPVR